MFRIVCDPSSGSTKLYLTEIRSGSLMVIVCFVGVWQSNFEPVVRGSKLSCQTPTKHTTNIN